MRLVTYEVEHKGGLGVISRDGKWVYPLRSLDMDYKTMQELIEGISESEKQLLEYVSGQDPYKIRGAAPIEEVKFLAPIPNPKQDVICLGINYMAHAEESARYKKEAFGGERPYAVYFSKRVNEAVANGEGIESHSDIVTDLDYEVELAVIIGKEAKNVPEEEVKNYTQPEKGGVALVNVNNRIHLLSGEEYGMHVYSLENVGTSVELSIPVIYNENELKKKEL